MEFMPGFPTGVSPSRRETLSSKKGHGAIPSTNCIEPFLTARPLLVSSRRIVYVIRPPFPHTPTLFALRAFRRAALAFFLINLSTGNPPHGFRAP